MSLLRNVLIYMGLGPDEDYDDGYLQDGDGRRSDQRRAEGRRGDRTPADVPIDLTDQADDPAVDIDVDEPDPHAPRERPPWLADQGGAGPVPPPKQAERAERVAPGRGAGPASAPDPADDLPVDSGTGGSVAGGSGTARVETAAAVDPVGRRERPAADRRAELRTPGGAKRPLRAVPPAELGIQTDLVLPENGLTVRSVPMEAEMVRDTSAAEVGPSQRRQVMPRIVSPDSFGDAKSLADDFMRSTPIVLNLQRVERDLARRLIDFASGLCYALKGSMEKLAPQVFLLIPPDVEVAEVDRRRIAQRGYED